MNVSVVVGNLSRPPEHRSLPSGEHVVGFDVVATEGGRRTSVPVVWRSPPPAASSLDTGVEVMVVGAVERRFFRVAGATQSRTEVVAASVVPVRQVAAARRSLAEAVASLAAAESALPAARRRRARPAQADEAS